MYDALCRFAKAKRNENMNGEWNGHVPQKYATYDEPPLKRGAWITKQRTLYKMNQMSVERVIMLERMGLIWSCMIVLGI